MSPPSRLLGPRRQVGHRRRYETGLGPDLRGVGGAERAGSSSSMSVSVPPPAPPLRAGGTRHDEAGWRGPLLAGAGPVGVVVEPLLPAAWRKASSPSRSLGVTARRRFALASGTCWVASRSAAGVAIAVAMDDERPGWLGRVGIMFSRRSRDDEQAEDTEEAEQDDRARRRHRRRGQARGRSMMPPACASRRRRAGWGCRRRCVRDRRRRTSGRSCRR